MQVEKNSAVMSINVLLHEGKFPFLVSPCENFFFIVTNVKLTVESGSGYPGQGGCFYGREGKCYVSQYRVVFVSENTQHTDYSSFSLPLYAIRDWGFHVSFFGGKTWSGHVNRVPGGGLIGIGSFSLQFLSYGFEEFKNHVEPLLLSSRNLFRMFERMSTPSVLMVPDLPEKDDAQKIRFAYVAPHDPFTLFVIVSSTKHK